MRAGAAPGVVGELLVDEGALVSAPTWFLAYTPGDDDVPFNFQNKDKIKRLYVSPDTHKLISAGKLVIVNDNGVFELVPPAIAEKIRARNPSLVIDLPSDEEPSADDPYADYQVPDDLIW